MHRASSSSSPCGAMVISLRSKDSGLSPRSLSLAARAPTSRTQPRVRHSTVGTAGTVSYTHLRAHETSAHL
eukprot:14475458-Alexandrium_andersonii.AAC.1